jgi:prepilin-type processing-associated H-X9-DG protein
MNLYIADHDGFLPRRGQGVQPVFRIEREDDWFNALPPYLGEKSYKELYDAGTPPRPGQRSVFVCPSAKPTSHRHFLCYGMNMYLSRWDKAEATRIVGVTDSGSLAVMADSPGGYASTVPSAAAYSTEARHGGRANILFLDGRVRAFRGDYLGCGAGDISHPDIRWQIEETDGWRPGR